MPTVQTVLGRIEADQLGVTYSHDHLIFRPGAPFSEQDPDLRLDSFEAARAELGFFKAAGGQALVEMTTVEVGRTARELQALSEQTGVHIIAATGYNKARFCAQVVRGKSVDELVQEMADDLTQGMDGTASKAGLIKASSSQNEMQAEEERVFQAAVQAHHLTGAPISTHTEAGTYALEQIRLLLDGGVRPEHICIGHLDRKLDWGYHQEIADSGVFMLFDQISKEKYYPDSQRIEFIQRLIEAGHGPQILLSGDLGRKSYWPSYGFGGGPGLTYILWRFVPWMLERGIHREDVDHMLIANPARAFAWRD
jgi:predicted metal-dependent phosphotriesterase family hydrolase